ncbi:MAG: hypothetical protein ACXVA9_02840 [Bdellovibrionales bacterium]
MHTLLVLLFGFSLHAKTQFSQLITPPVKPPPAPAPAFGPPVAKPKKTDKKDKKDDQKPQMPQMPSGGGGAGSSENKDSAKGGSGEGKSGDSSKGAGNNGPSGDGLCTTKNNDKVQQKEKGCQALETSLEQGCAADKLKQVLKRAKNPKGISDMKDFCPGFESLPSDKKSELFKQVLAGTIEEHSHWQPNSGYFNITKEDVDKYQDCHGIDLSKPADTTNGEKNLKCGTCVSLTKIAKEGKIANALNPDAKQAIATKMQSFCKDPSGGAAKTPAATPPSDRTGK